MIDSLNGALHASRLFYRNCLLWYSWQFKIHLNVTSQGMSSFNNLMLTASYTMVTLTSFMLDCISPSFGINHDGVGNTCSRSGFMMASDGGYNSVDLTWSPCSRQQLLTFFRWANLFTAAVQEMPFIYHAHLALLNMVFTLKSCLHICHRGWSLKRNLY